MEQNSFSNLCYFLAGIIAILGAVTVYYKAQHGRENDIKKFIMLTVGSCVFFIGCGALCLV